MTRSAPQRRVRAASDPKRLLGQLLRTRRNYLHLGQDDLRNRFGPNTGPGEETVRKWERGDIPVNPQRDTFTKFETALELASGSCLAVLQGRASDLAVQGNTGRAVLTAQVSTVDCGPDSLQVTRRQIAELVMRSSRLVDLTERDLLTAQGGSDEALMNARAMRDLIGSLTARMDALYNHDSEVLRGLTPGTSFQLPLANDGRSA